MSVAAAPMLKSVAAVVVGLAAALGAVIVWLDAPAGDVLVLGLTLAGTGAAGVAASVLAGRLLRDAGLRARLVVFALIGMGVLAGNILVASILMFISTHDLRLLVILVAFAVIATMGPAELMTHAIQARLAPLREAAERMAGGDLTARAAIAGNDEVHAVAAAFNAMAEEIEAAVGRRESVERSRRELFAAISHDLRTPLASLQAMAEAIEDGVVGDPATLRQYSSAMGTNVSRLSRLIDDLFELARIDSGDLRLDIRWVQVNDVLALAVGAVTPEALQAGLAVRFEPGGPLAVLADAARLDRVISNILGNAIRHTPGDGLIVLRTRAVGPDVHISITDSGEGIDAQDRPRVFERFFRGDRARRTGTGGSGLGLSIARGIVEAHGGRIWLDSEPGAGTTVTISLPGEA